MSRPGAIPWLLAAAIATAAFRLFEALSGHAAGWLAYLLLTVVAFSAGRARSKPAGAAALTILLGAIAASQAITFHGGDVIPEFMLPITIHAAGLALRNREQLAQTLADHGHELTVERDAYAQLSVRYERARVAAELHDVIAHAISMMVVQASAGQRLAANDPARTADTFKIITTTARQAQSDLERLADLLAADIADAKADLSLITEVVETACASGLPVTLRVTGDTTRVSDQVAHAALRVVQEGLTNALRYAPGADIQVGVDVGSQAIELTVNNDKPAAPGRLGLGSDRGLRGLRERLAALGGTLHAGPEHDGSWIMHARIPN